MSFNTSLAALGGWGNKAKNVFQTAMGNAQSAAEKNVATQLAKVNPVKSYISNVGKRYQQAAGDVISGVKEGATQMEGALKNGYGLNPLQNLKTNVGMMRGAKTSGLRTTGAVAGAALAPITETGLYKKGTETLGNAVKAYINYDPLGQTAGRLGNLLAGRKFIPSKNTMPQTAAVLTRKASELAAKYPEQAKDLKNISDIATVVGLNAAETAARNALKVKPTAPSGNVAPTKTYPTTRDNLALDPRVAEGRLNDIAMKANNLATGKIGTDAPIYKQIMELGKSKIDSPGQFYVKVADVLKANGMWNEQAKISLMETMGDLQRYFLPDAETMPGYINKLFTSVPETLVKNRARALK